ncbi:hypothetical protein H310_01886 [Aphanomyces invadans]|uniref:Ion transport domain-containing protein n=1 Tax=Aphanomyces invadans TaxID=157072 RepID=A0A024UME8_9STRA|nr:hypothetical protein H310_01886 [Aphanomyces invadans]ETW07350.1 hypothetical protein H310_01886 [Aphanomyces invadans]|eukprot:XP_008863443.1 hypothetical protein H310_01886 [Aphanomyces invadans]
MGNHLGGPEQVEEKQPMANAPSTYGSSNSGVQTRDAEEENLQRELREHVEARRVRGITLLLKKKRALALDLMAREMKRTKSGPPTYQSSDSLLNLPSTSVQGADAVALDRVDDDNDDIDQVSQTPASKWRVSFEVERTSRLLIYAKQEWKHAQQLAVEAQVGHFIIRCMTPKVVPAVKKGSSAKKAAGESSGIPKCAVNLDAPELALLELIYEFVAGGYEPAQNALYRAMLELYDDDDNEATADVDRKDIFLRFLLKYIRLPTINKFSVHYQKMALAIVQLLCENHNPVWQTMMQEPCEDTTVLAAIIRIMEGTKPSDPLFVKCMRCLIEACQGPCPDNQAFVVTSTATTLVCQVLLTDPTSAEALDVWVYQTASELLLSLMEGRSDSSVNAELAHLFDPVVVVDRLVTCYRELCRIYGVELSFERDDIHRHVLYVRAMSMLVVAVRIMSLEATADLVFDEHLGLSSGEDDDDSDDGAFLKPSTSMSLPGPDTDKLAMRNRIQRAVRNLSKQSKESHVTLSSAIKKVVNINRAMKQFDLRSVQGFRTQWDGAIDDRNALGPIRFFHTQLISIELVVHGTTTTLYFVKPADAMYFDELLQNELLDAMDIGSDKAMEVLLSETAKSIDEELKVIKHLRRHAVYAFLARWQTDLRNRLLSLCFYINFVMLLLLKWDGPESFVFLQVLGIAYLAGALVLLGFYVTKQFNFNYCKQQLSLTKLHFRSPKAIRDRVWEVWQGPIQCFEIILWTVSLIVYVNGWNTYGSIACCTVAGVAMALSTLRAIRETSNVFRFSVNSESSYAELKAKLGNRMVKTKFRFWYSVLYDTLFSESVLAFLAYSTCGLLGLIATSHRYLYYGFPLLDLVATNGGLRFVVKAMTTNTSKLTITAVFGAVVIYVFALNGFYFFQTEMTTASGTHECHSLMQCFMTHIHNGLLSGGGIGDYTSNNPLDYTLKASYFGRVGYDLGFYVVVIVLLLNLIQGIIIDAFTAVREASENKLALQRQQCLVCNRSRTVIEADGMEKGVMNSFARHTETKHNLFNYFFFVKYLKAKDETDMNGMESFVYEKIKTKDMSWVPRV